LKSEPIVRRAIFEGLGQDPSPVFSVSNRAASDRRTPKMTLSLCAIRFNNDQ
jgi:hypothetical protein